MNIDKIAPGENPPNDINVVIEIPGGSNGGSPVKYEIDKESGALFVDRIVNVPMFYPAAYGFVPNTLHEDGDPVDVLVYTAVDLIPGSVIRCRLVGVLHMEDDGGLDDKLIALPITKVDPFQAEIETLEDLPQRFRDRLGTSSRTTSRSKRASGPRSAAGATRQRPRKSSSPRSNASRRTRPRPDRRQAFRSSEPRSSRPGFFFSGGRCRRRVYPGPKGRQTPPATGAPSRRSFQTMASCRA